MVEIKCKLFLINTLSTKIKFVPLHSCRSGEIAGKHHCPSLESKKLPVLINTLLFVGGSNEGVAGKKAPIDF